MKIHRYGTVTLRENLSPLIEGWNIEREPEDPTDATDEQLLLGFAITWAKQRFEAALNMAVLDVFRKKQMVIAAQSKAAMEEFKSAGQMPDTLEALTKPYRTESDPSGLVGAMKHQNKATCAALEAWPGKGN